MYFHSNAFAFNPQTHLCFYTYLIKFEEEAVSKDSLFSFTVLEKTSPAFLKTFRRMKEKTSGF